MRKEREKFDVGDRVVVALYDPTAPAALVGRHGIILKVARRRGIVQFDHEPKPRFLHLSALKKLM